jgi:WD40 repeat protein
MYTFDEVQRLRSIGGIRSLCFSPDQNELAVGGMGHVGNVDGLGGKTRIEWFDPTTGQQTGLFESETHKGLIEDMHYHQDGSHLIAGGGNNKGFLITLNTSTKKAVHEPEAPMHVHQFKLNANHNQLFAVGHQKIASWSIHLNQST